MGAGGNLLELTQCACEMTSLLAINVVYFKCFSNKVSLFSNKLALFGSICSHDYRKSYYEVTS